MTFKNILLISFIVLNTSYGFTQSLLLETGMHSDCNNHFIASKIISNDEFVSTNAISLRQIVFEGFLSESKFKDGYAPDGIYIANDEFKKFFPQGIAKPYFEDFLKALPAGIPQDKSEVYILTDVANQLITFAHIDNGHFRGYPHSLKLDGCISAAKLIESEVKAAKERSIKILWYGDEIANLQIRPYCDANEITLYRRAIGINKPLPNNLAILDKSFDPKQSVLFNAIPNSERAVYNMKEPLSRTNRWKAFHSTIEKLIGKEFSERISTKEGFKQELLAGDKDVMIVFAHLDGSKLYIGDELITFQEIKNWGQRQKATNGNRTGFLFICNSGNPNYSQNNFFSKKELDPLCNLLINNHYFDLVIAPDHNIEKTEVSDIFRSLIERNDQSKFDAKRKYWWWWVTNKIVNNIIFNS